jgi:beta-lactamase regulating signal transducer with metallopeptidase domain
MEQILKWLIDSSIIAGFIILIILVFRPLLKKLPKWVNLVLWLIVAVRLVMPVGLESNFSLVPDIGGLQAEYSKVIFGVSNPEAGNDNTVNHRDVVETADSGNAFNTQNFANTDINAETQSLPMHTEETDQQMNTLASNDDGATDVVKTEIGNNFEILEIDNIEKPDNLVQIIMIIWIIGCGLMLAYFIYSIIRIKRSVRISIPAELPFNLKTKSLVPIYVCEGIKSPFIMGLIGTKLYIPEGMDESTLEYVIQHENAHIKHFDQLWKVLGFVLLMVYWFNPFVWIAFICFSKDLELACDERAAGKLTPQERAGYSEALLVCSIHNRILAVCPVAFGETGVKERVKAVISIKKPLKIVIACIILGCTVFALCFLTDPASAKEKESVDKTNNDIETKSSDILDTDISVVDSGIDFETDDGISDNTDNQEVTDIQEDTDIQDDVNTETNDTLEDDASSVINEYLSDEPDEKEQIDEEIENIGLPEVTEIPEPINDSVKLDSTESIETDNKEEDNTDTSETVQTPSDEKAVIPYGIKEIKERAFIGTETIKSVILPDTVEAIGDGAFAQCYNLESVVFTPSLKTIGREAFRNCGFKTITIPDTVESLGYSMLADNRKLQYCKLPENITEIPDYMFASDEKLKNVEFSSSLTKIGNNAFWGCHALEAVNIPDAVKIIGEHAFSQTGLKEVWIPEGVEVISYGMFANCEQLERVYLPDTVTVIDIYAFSECSNLKEIYIPENVTTINDYAFYNCTKLEVINIPDSLTEISNNAFWLCTKLPEESKAAIRKVNKKVRFDYVK